MQDSKGREVTVGELHEGFGAGKVVRDVFVSGKKAGVIIDGGTEFTAMPADESFQDLTGIRTLEAAAEFIASTV